MAVPEREHYLELASGYGVELLFEAFVDRVYADDGRLTPRTLQDHHTPRLRPLHPKPYN
ncbi:hypothetical protein JCM19235_194 [Vibrio maritimus]|uniref:Uncharacterized protein n=1 Tax=Vibrio maritimus TaxID=990268 RepID=A0A090S343_9VIBR|nr:hypothetical protein JCM19235_194 [Vibrio maritimus]